MNCFMFPGQPLSLAAPLPDDPDFAEVARKTGERTAFDLSTRSWTKGEYSENVGLQVYGAAMSLYRNRILAGEGATPQIIAEHSMGIYAALAACGSVSEDDALELVFRIGVCFSAMAKKEEYALGSVIGLTLDPISAIASNNGIYLANLNTSRHFLLSGVSKAMENAMAEALTGGAFSAKAFPSDAPLHSPLMEEVATTVGDICKDYSYREPAVPILDHIDQKLLKPSEMAQFMVRELMLPVYWERSYLALKERGVAKFIEAGSGDSLKKYNRWIDSENRSG